MKRWINFFLFLVIISSLTGCVRPAQRGALVSQVATGVQVRCESCDSVLEKHFTMPEKVRLILLCLRLLGPDFPTRDDVDALGGRTIQLTLRCADGSRHTYRLRGNQYLQKDGGAWREINAEQAAGFFQLLMELTDDGPDATLPEPDRASLAYRVYSPALRNAGRKKEINFLDFFEKRA